MKNLVSIDNGRSKVAVKTNAGLYQFPAVVSDATELRNPQYLKDDIEVEFDGKICFVGGLAKREGRFKSYNYGNTKATETTLMQFFAACWLSQTQGSVDLCLPIPIDNYTKEERKAIRSVLNKNHTFRVRGVRFDKELPDWDVWSVNVENILITQECQVGYWADPQSVHTQTIDFGAFTTNYSTHDKDRTYINELSGTFFDTGWETIKEKEGFRDLNDDELVPDEIKRITRSLSKYVCDRLLKMGFNERRKTQIIGGVAPSIIVEVKKFFPNAYMIKNPRLANVNGCYYLGKEVLRNYANQL